MYTSHILLNIYAGASSSASSVSSSSDSSSCSSSGSYSCSSSSSSVSSSCSSSSSSTSSSSVSSSSSSSSSYSGPFYVRNDALGGGIGNADTVGGALTLDEFINFPATPGTTMLIKGVSGGHTGVYLPLGPIDWLSRPGNYHYPVTIKGYLTHPDDIVERGNRPNFIVTGSSSSSSSS